MKKVAFIFYRQWANEIYKDIDKFLRERGDFEIPVLMTIKNPDISIESLSINTKKCIVNPNDNDTISSILQENKIDLVIYYGWSWIVKEPILSRHTCICLHPSKLPQYRGGSPIQNQIISGEKESAVTVFRMGTGLDDGPIYSQLSMSLEGEIEDIFWRMCDLGKIITRNLITDLICGELKFTSQISPDKFPIYLRRDLAESELRVEEIEKMTFNQINNFVRSLGAPYPNAFIKFGDDKLLIQRLIKFKNIGHGKVINKVKNQPLDINNCYLKLSDSYAKLTKGELRSGGGKI